MSPENHALYPTAVGRDPIRRYTSALAKAARSADLGTAVTTCGEWTLADLIWHLTQVQDFWTHVIATRPAEPTNYEAPTRPSDARLIANLQNASVGLTSVLELVSADEAAWNWSSDHTVGFTLRRQTHEALIHTIDAILALGLSLPDVSPELAADGIDEIVHVMLEPTAATGTIDLHATDTDDRWTINFGDSAAGIAGTALELDLWLWGRSRAPQLTFSGDTEQIAAFRANLASETQ